MKKSQGYSVEDKFVDAMKKVRSFVYKFTDSKEVRGRAAKIKAVPADYIVASKGVFPTDFCLVEIKSCADEVSFPFGNIQKMQWVALTILQKIGLGHHYYIAIYSIHHQGWFILDANEILSQEAKSIKWTNAKRFTALEDLLKD